MPRSCEWCGAELPEKALRRSGRRLKFCTKKCQRDAYAAAAGTPVTRRHTGRPDTSDRLYSDDEFEFLKAVERWRKQSGRIPNCTEILAIARELGYSKHPENTRPDRGD